MTTESTTAAAFDDIDQEFNDEKAFAREERIDILQLVELHTDAMPEDAMERQQINYKSEAFKAAYPKGLPSLVIGLKGVSVSYDFMPDKIRRIYIPLFGTEPDKLGQRKGRNSKAHITKDAFVQVFGLSPFGRDNQAKLIGRVARWGQHLGEAVVGGSAREWAWDVPREALPADFKYEGQVRSIQGRAGAQSPGTTIGTPPLAESDANDKIIEALLGLAVTDAETANKRILDIPGLPDSYYTRAMSGNVLQLAHENGLIAAEEGKVVRAKQEEAAIA